MTELLFTQKPTGPLLLGAWHTHPCPKCGALTTGTGKTLCFECARPTNEKEEENEAS